MPKYLNNIARLEADFEKWPERAFSKSELESIFAESPVEWNLPRSMTSTKFIAMLRGRSKLSRVTLKSDDYPPLLRYVWGRKISPVLLALSIKRHAYCSHASAMWIHGLGGNERKVFVNSEQSEKPPNRGALTQEAIDRAFRNEQRQSRLAYTYRGATMVVLSGKNSGQLEVAYATTPSGSRVEVTSLERTLIDITVRPAYAGGIPNVLEAFRRARGRISMEKLLRVLQALAYTYPYHQSIGFYMKRSGHAVTDQELVRQLGTRFNFYLGHGLNDVIFDEEFKVYFPKSLQ